MSEVGKRAKRLGKVHPRVLRRVPCREKPVAKAKAHRVRRPFGFSYERAVRWWTPESTRWIRQYEWFASAANKGDLDALAPAWREFQARTPVKLCTLENERHYRAMVNLMNKIVEEIGDRETPPLMGLLDIVTFFVRDYEERNIEIPDAEPPAVLRFLMEQHDLRQADIAEIFGSQSNVSEVLNGKRDINARQARALAERFGVSPAVFI